jgi:hypothetical protein
MLQPYERLKRVFEHHADRLRRKFRLGDHVYKWMRDTDDFGTGAANPLDRVRDIIDEALIVDPTGKGAWLIASDGVEYCAALLTDRVGTFNQKEEVSAVISQSAHLVCGLNEKDIAQMSTKERKQIAEHVSDLDCTLKRVKALLNESRPTNARQFVQPRDGRIGSGD